MSRRYPGAARLVLLALLVVPASAATRERSVARTWELPPRDIFSAAETAAVRVRHLELDLEVDFAARRIRGTATHTIENLAATDRFIVDTRDLEILGATIDGSATTWSLGEPTAAGRALSIGITPSTRSVRIEYETTRTSGGLYWLMPLQTFGDEAPFLFTLGQPDRTRDWIPIQDTPGVRMSYGATIRVPPGLLALMSARNPTATSPDGTYRIEMPYPIPPYLIALAVGRLEFRSLDGRSGIYAEPVVLDDAMHDLSYVPEMMGATEEFLGAYPFERYDLVLLPPSFPAGGMENPMLNFINVASVVSGNRESPPLPHGLIAHELAHSWAGDLVTCGTWSDTWLNEGFATYYASRIMEAMRGFEIGEIGHWFDRSGFESYVQQTADSRREVLHIDFRPGDPLSIFSPTSYNKGSLFLKMLEDRMGRETFDRFARSYFARYANGWVDDRAFLDHLARYVPDGDALLLEAWIYEPGLPSNVTAPARSTLWDRIAVEAGRFRSGAAASSLDTNGWTSYEHGLFLWQITDLVGGRIAELDAEFGYSTMATPSIHWFLAVASRLYAPGIPMLESYLRRATWNALPIFERLSQTAGGRAWAIALYESVRPHYVEGMQSYIDAILDYQTASLRDAA